MQSAEPGRIVGGRYRLSAVIGHGGMGVVWRARDELLSRDVAVKEMIWPPHLTERERQAACRRATREAQAAARLSHRNVIRVYDIAEEDDGCPWIVMELLPYRSLLDVIEDEGPLTPAEAARVGLQVLAALRAAHAEGIVHRDVKPANILIGPGNRAVLTDFGIAYLASGTATTTSGVLIGSPSYIAPERARGGPSDAPGDLWGLGASLYAAVEGRPPFERVNALASLTAVVADELEPATHAGRLWPVLSGLLRKTPHARLDAAETERLLRGVIAAPADAVSPATVGTPAAPRTRRSRGPLVAAAGSAALLVLAVGGIAAGLDLTSSSQDPAAPSAVMAHLPATSTRPATASTHPSTPASPHLTDRTSPARTSRPYVSYETNQGSRHGHGHSHGQGNND